MHLCNIDSNKVVLDREADRDSQADAWLTICAHSIIFSCWTRTLDLVETYLLRNQIPFLRIDGEILLSKRQKILDDFAEPASRERVMLMTTGTGAFG